MTRARTRWGLLPFLIGALAACAASTSSDADHSIDFSRFKTYAWKEVRAKQNPAVEAEILSAVDSALAARGLRKVSSSPDLWVVEHTRLSTEAQVSTYDSGWGYAAAPGWGSSATTGTVAPVSVGDLLVDLVDAANQKLVWRGSARQAVDPAASAEKRERRISDAVAKMFAAYPPKP